MYIINTLNFVGLKKKKIAYFDDLNVYAIV